MNLAEILKRPEGKTLEFKREISSNEGIVRSAVAFANTAGGILVLGVEDKTRHVCGIKDPLGMEERLANLIIDNISPHMIPEIEMLPWRNTHVVAVQVYPSPFRPHYLKSHGPQNGVFVRVGSTNRMADSAMIEEMRRFSANKSFDEQPMPKLKSEAINFRAASDLFAPVRKLRRSDLRSLQLTSSYQGREVPTVGGFLLFGKDRTRQFPDAWIQAGLFRSTDKSHILDTVKISSYLPMAVEEAILFVKRHTSQESVIGEVRRTDRRTLPPLAVREAVVNAVVHADYSQRGAPIRLSIFSDRIEVESPGLLPFGLTVDDLREGISKIRNRVIARVFHELGLIEQWGSGIQRMMAVCRASGLEEPIFEEVGIHFRVTIPMIRKRAPWKDDVDQNILHALEIKKTTGLSTVELSTRIKRSPRATRTRLLSLLERGLVVEIGSGPHDPRRRYHFADRK